ncbi:MAG TPA: hypothetical protein VGJ20_34285 [Xanthobacteraceae bacterium]|jgi:hypothetical protein
MSTKKIILAIAFLLSAAPVALAQSAYTSGTEASRVRAGYPSPYGYSSGLSSYAQTSGYGRAIRGLKQRGAFER